MLNAARTLILAISVLCLTVDIENLNHHLINSQNYLTDRDARDEFKIVSIWLIYFIINDAISFLIGVYYVLSIEKKWNTPPSVLDYVICCVETILWVVYGILGYNHPEGFFFNTTRSSYGITAAFFYALIILLFRSQRINMYGGYPLGGMTMNPGFTMNPGYGMNPGFGLNNSGFRMNNPGYGMNNPGFGMNNPGFGINNPGYGMNNTGFGMNNQGNNNNPTVNTNNPSANNAENNAGSEVRNAGSEVHNDV